MTSVSVFGFRFSRGSLWSRRNLRGRDGGRKSRIDPATGPGHAETQSDERLRQLFRRGVEPAFEELITGTGSPWLPMPDQSPGPDRGEDVARTLWSRRTVPSGMTVTSTHGSGFTRSSGTPL